MICFTIKHASLPEVHVLVRYMIIISAMLEEINYVVWLEHPASIGEEKVSPLGFLTVI